MSEHKLTDEQWAAVQPHVPIPKGETEEIVRRLLDGIIYAGDAQSEWTDVEQEYGPFEPYLQRFTQWEEDGTWKQILKSLQSVMEEKRWSDLIPTMYGGIHPTQFRGLWNTGGSTSMIDRMFSTEEKPPPKPITDEQWESIKHLFTDSPSDEDSRQLVDGIFYGQFLGHQWDKLPEEFGSPERYRMRQSQWMQSGLWHRIMMELMQNIDPVDAFDWAQSITPNLGSIYAQSMTTEQIDEMKQAMKNPSSFTLYPSLFSGRLTVNYEKIKQESDVPTKYATIQEAIDAAEDGATIKVFQGIYEENLTITKPISIVAGAARLVASPDSHAIHCKDAGIVTLSFKSIEQHPYGRSSDEERECGLKVEGKTEAYINRTKFLDWTVSLEISDDSKAFINSCKFYSEKGYRDGPTVVGVSVINAFAEVYDCDFHFNSGAEFLSALSGHNSEVNIHDSSFFLQGNPGGVVDLITLIDCKAEIHDNYLMAPETECLIIDGSQGVKISNNTIISKILAIEIKKSSSKLESKEILLEQNRISGTGMSAGIGIWDNHVTVRGNTVMGYESGILIVTGSALVEDNLVVGNNKCGVAFSEFASQLIFNNNKIVGNSDVGIGIWKYRYLHPEQEAPTLKTIEGKHNIVSGNLQEDLRLKDISLPSDFLTQE